MASNVILNLVSTMSMKSWFYSIVTLKWRIAVLCTPQHSTIWIRQFRSQNCYPSTIHLRSFFYFATFLCMKFQICALPFVSGDILLKLTRFKKQKQKTKQCFNNTRLVIDANLCDHLAANVNFWKQAMFFCGESDHIDSSTKCPKMTPFWLLQLLTKSRRNISVTIKFQSNWDTQFNICIKLEHPSRSVRQAAHAL